MDKESKRIGSLYKIVNNINDKVYIGKTYTSLEVRLNSHINDRTKKRMKHIKFYRALNKHGVDNFKIILIGKFEEGILEEKEIEYISKYDSYKNGYNSTLGGDGFYVMSNDDIDFYIECYNNGMSIVDIHKKYGRHMGHLRNLFEERGIKVNRHKDVILDKNEISNLYKNGKTLAEIAKMFNVEAYLISGVLIDAGIKIKKSIINQKNIYKNLESNKVGFLSDMLEVVKLNGCGYEELSDGQIKQKIKDKARLLNGDAFGLHFKKIDIEDIGKVIKIIPDKHYIDEFVMPKKGSDRASCYDCYCYDIKEYDDYIIYDLGFSYELPFGYHLELYARSSVYKTGLILSNSVGILDNDYTGNVMAIFYKINNKKIDKYEIGDRVCQIKLVKDDEFELMLSCNNARDTERGTGGFGSTGNK